MQPPVRLNAYLPIFSLKLDFAYYKRVKNILLEYIALTNLNENT